MDTPPNTILSAAGDAALKASKNAGSTVGSLMRGEVGAIDRPEFGDPVIADAPVHTADPVRLAEEATNITSKEEAVQKEMP